MEKLRVDSSSCSYQVLVAAEASNWMDEHDKMVYNNNNISAHSGGGGGGGSIS